jgi:hypothetical protein
MHVWIARRDQARRLGEQRLGDFLDPREREPWFPQISVVPPDDAEAIDCIWFQRGGSALLFEVEWTAMLGEPLLRRHARIQGDEALVRFLVIAPERTELVRYKLARSPLLREAVATGNWHILKSSHLRTFLAREPLSLDDLEPYLGLDPVVERRGEQMALFGG